MGHDSKSYITQVPTSRNSFLRCGVKTEYRKLDTGDISWEKN